MKKLLFILGTRPEALKLYSPIQFCRDNPRLSTQVCHTNQHTDLIDPFIEQFGIEVDFSLPLKNSPLSLHQLVSKQLEELEAVLEKAKPDLVIVQGDTSSAFAGALAAHYLHIPVAHVEAGLRSEDLFAPWPEEMHRRLIDQICTYFFVPSEAAKECLVGEGVPSSAIWVVGNTSVDALINSCEKLSRSSIPDKKSIVVTIHRRENQGEILHGICAALKTVALSAKNVEIQFVLHENPVIKEVVEASLSEVKNIRLLSHLNHHQFLETILNSTFVVTDSGGVQEEAPYIGKPLLVVRDATERPEGIEKGTARLIGTSPDQIVAHCMELIGSPEVLESMSIKHQPYGKGDSGKQIADILDQVLA